MSMLVAVISSASTFLSTPLTSFSFYRRRRRRRRYSTFQAIYYIVLPRVIERHRLLVKTTVVKSEGHRLKFRSDHWLMMLCSVVPD